MKLNQVAAAAALAIGLGLVVLIALGGANSLLGGSSPRTVRAQADSGGVINSPTPLFPPLTETRPIEISATATAAAPGVSPTSTATLAPVEVGSKKGPESESLLLLYDSTHVTNFDTNFCKIAEYYGLICKKVDLNAGNLSDQTLVGRRGHYFKLIGISADTLLRQQPVLKSDGVAAIKSAVEKNGVGLFVGKVKGTLSTSLLTDLTDGGIVGVTKPPIVPHKEWIVSSSAPEITQAFTGQVISYTISPKYEYALSLGKLPSVTTLITSTNNAETFPVFVRYQKGAGSIFIDSGEEANSLETAQLAKMYGASAFSMLAPLMMAIRYELGDQAWHAAHYYANLTLDDPALTEPFSNLDYSALLEHMQAHNFHTTIAFVPANYQKSELSVVNLFLEHPDRYSLVQHGNNHDGYEFYRYSVSANDQPPPISDPSEFNPANYTARPLAEQEANIVQGLSRMGEHQKLTGISFDQVMIFPYGISPAPTLALLKKYNYLATVNDPAVPLDATTPTNWDYGMYQANMDYSNFPSLLRRSPGTYLPFRPNLQPFLSDLFLGKPALFYSHAYPKELFADGRVDAFDQLADEINKLPIPVEWRSLGYIVKHLYLEKLNNDGSVDVKIYSNDVIVSPLRAGITYHISKEETLSVPIEHLSVNGQEFPYRIEQGVLKLDAVSPGDQASLEIKIRYAE